MTMITNLSPTNGASRSILHRVKRLSALTLALMAVSVGNQAFAQTLILIEASPAAWRLQYTIGGPAGLFYTGSECANGNLSFPSTAVQEDYDKLWALILAAKATGTTVFVYYSYSATAGCIISSFGTDAS